MSLEAFKAGFYSALRSEIKRRFNPIFPDRSLRLLFEEWTEKGDDFWPED